jgi:hypothetical protein
MYSDPPEPNLHFQALVGVGLKCKNRKDHAYVASFLFEKPYAANFLREIILLYSFLN